MSIFKRSKSKEFLESLKKENFVVIPPDVPEVIKESKIKPTKCYCCHTLYQARKEHFRLEPDIAYRFEKYTVHTICPICRNLNAVEFEEAEE